MKYSHTIEPGLDAYVVNGKVKVIPTKEYLDYRKEELHPELIELINIAWEKENRVYHSNIDALIDMQAQSVEQAKRYIGYRFLGTYSYLDVFGKNAKEEYEKQQSKEHNNAMEKKLDNMQQQLWDMQKLLINLSKQQNSNMRRTG